MSSKSTNNLKLNIWAGTDYLKRLEMNNNFETLDQEVASKETPKGAQDKADSAESSANSYTDNQIKQIPDTTWANTTGKPSKFPPEDHTHNISEIHDLARQLVNKANQTDLDTTIKTMTQDDEVTVGSGGDFSTINEAISDLMQRRPATLSDKTGNPTATIMLKSGYVIEEQIKIDGLNLGWITIKGEDSYTVIDLKNFEENVHIGESPIASAFSAINGAVFPTLQHQFKTRNKPASSGFASAFAGIILNGSGIHTYYGGMQVGGDASGLTFNIALYASSAVLRSSKFTNQDGTEGKNNIQIMDGSIVNKLKTDGGVSINVNQMTDSGIVFED